MPSPNATPTPITPPRVPLIDPRTGLIDRAWYLFFLSLNNVATGVIDDSGLTFSSESLLASYDAALQALAQEVETQPLPVDLSAELTKQIEAAGLVDCCSGLLSQVAEMQKQIEALTVLPPSLLGSVTSVGLSLPTEFTVTDSPVTSSGTLTATWVSQTAKYFFAAPNATSGTPSFRAIVASDIPALSYVSSVTGTSPVLSSGGLTPDISLASGYGDTQNPYASKTANYVLAAPNGSAGVPTFRALVAADVPGSALTKTDDTNVTLTLGGSPTTALLNAASLTLGWTGQLGISRGGTNTSTAPSAYGVVYGNSGGTAYTSLANGTTGQVLTATTGGAPTWAAPATSGTVTSVSVVSANGFAGTVATATTTPAITLTTSITGVLKGNGTAISAAVVNTDYFAPSAPVTKTANFTVADTEVWLINNKSGSTCTATLPAASSWSGRVLRFQNYQAQTLVSASSNVVPLAGGAAATSILLASTGDSATLVSDGTNWLMTQYIPNNILLLE